MSVYYICTNALCMYVSDLVEAVVLSGAEYFLDIVVRRGGEGRRRGGVRGPELVTREVGSVEVGGVGLGPGK